MKNEVFARAITGIDDELIMSAHESTGKVKKNRSIFYICVAACLVFVCGIALLAQHSDRPEISVYGNTLSDKPVLIDVPAPLSSDARQIVLNIISVPLEIVTDDNININAVDGMIEVYSLKNSKLLYSGQSCGISDSVAVQWIIEDPDFSRIYRLEVDNADVLLLSYNEDNKNWIMERTAL